MLALNYSITTGCKMLAVKQTTMGTGGGFRFTGGGKRRAPSKERS